MQFAYIGNNRVEPTRNLKAFCKCCNEEVIAKMGDIKIHHWSHKPDSNCRANFKNESEWHLKMKSYFPKEFQEIIHTDMDTGEKHIADVDTGEIIFEFQHSPMSQGELISRYDFYVNKLDRIFIYVMDYNHENHKSYSDKIISNKSKCLIMQEINNELFMKNCKLRICESSLISDLIRFLLNVLFVLNTQVNHMEEIKYMNDEINELSIDIKNLNTELITKKEKLKSIENKSKIEICYEYYVNEYLKNECKHWELKIGTPLFRFIPELDWNI